MRGSACRPRKTHVTARTSRPSERALSRRRTGRRIATSGHAPTTWTLPRSCAGIRRRRWPRTPEMTVAAFADFLYGSCLIDWKGMHERISRHAQLLDEAEEVWIVGDETDLRLSVAGRHAGVDAGTGKMPCGEV